MTLMAFSESLSRHSVQTGKSADFIHGKQCSFGNKYRFIKRYVTALTEHKEMCKAL